MMMEHAQSQADCLKILYNTGIIFRRLPTSTLQLIMIVPELNDFLRYLFAEFFFEILHALVKHVFGINVKVSAHSQRALCQLLGF